jgi:preprotein translocase subunit SecG
VTVVHYIALLSFALSLSLLIRWNRLLQKKAAQRQSTFNHGDDDIFGRKKEMNGFVCLFLVFFLIYCVSLNYWSRSTIGCGRPLFSSPPEAVETFKVIVSCIK